MSGHSKWSQIKHKKATTDGKRSRLFSKILREISVAAKNEPNPDHNPRLRKVIENARDIQVPNENIERAIEKAQGKENLEELIFEAYSQNGTALLIEVITDSKNRSIGEIKLILREYDAKWAEPGSVAWAFDSAIDEGKKYFKPKFPQPIDKNDSDKLILLIQKLEEHEDVQNIYNNAMS